MDTKVYSNWWRFLILFYTHIGWSSAYMSEEMSLINHILKQSSPHVRPVHNISDTISVRFGFELVHIVSINESDQTILVKVWLRMSWKNSLLTWRPYSWNNISSTRINSNLLWTPDIYLIENVGDGISSGPERYRTMVTVDADGTSYWNVPSLLQSSCIFDVNNFPYDHQNCKFKFLSWTHDQLELDIDEDTTPIITENYVNSTEWELHCVTKKRVSQKYACCPNPFVHLEYRLYLHRKSRYYFFNVVIPCLIQMLIILFTFFLPPDSGERISVAVTVLLVFAVYLDMLSNTLPKTSVSYPALARFYMAAMAGSALSIIATCFALCIHFKGAEKGVGPMPAWVKDTFLRRLAWYLCVHQNLRKHQDEELLALEDNISPSEVKLEGENMEVILGGIDKKLSKATGSSDKEISMATLMQEVRVITSLIEDQNLQDEIEEEWQMLAKVFDRLFFLFFFNIFVVSSFVILYPLYIAHLDVGGHYCNITTR